MSEESVTAEPDEAEYLVRLLFRIPAASPKEAVEGYLEQLMRHGLRNWSYRVEDEETGETWNLDGYGELIPIEADLAEDDQWDVDETYESSAPPMTQAEPAGMDPDLAALLDLSRRVDPR
jgi:hypothetical protein